MKRYKKYIMPYLSAFILGPLMMITEVVGEVMLPKLMSLIINNGVANHDVNYIVKMGLLMLAVVAMMMFGGIMGAYFGTKASVSFSADLRSDVFAKVQKFSFENIDEFSTGSLVTRLTNDITQIQGMVMMCLRMALRSPGMFIGALIMAFSINKTLALVILVVIPVLAIAIAVIMRAAFPKFELMQKKLDALNSGIQEALTNVRVVKSFVREDFEIQKFSKINTELKDTSLSAFLIVICNMPVMTLAMNVTTIAVVWFGGNLIIGGSMQVGDLTAFISYITQILSSLMMLSMIFLNASRAGVSLKRINEVLDKEIDLNDDQASQKEKTVEAGSIEFKDVSFAYRDEHGKNETVLENISFKAEPGQTIGIIGSTGSGKTSLVQLIPRLYDVTDGQVLVDGVDVRDYSLKNLRNGVGMVLQKNVLFSGSVEENLKWGDEDATMDEIRAAAESAQADGFVSAFKLGYGTMIDQGGTNVSGGQKQRLCIARALLKKPKILILDDSTSAVDTATEAKIRECFANELKDTTKLIIAQRISSIQDADMILVLEDGKIIGKGIHEDLIKTCEAYEEIYTTQIGSSMGSAAAIAEAEEVMA